MFTQLLGISNILLIPIRHENTDNAILTERFDTERSDDAGILAAGDADNGFAIGAILAEILTNPADNFVFDFDGVEGVGFGIYSVKIFLIHNGLLSLYRDARVRRPYS